MRKIRMLQRIMSFALGAVAVVLTTSSCTPPAAGGSPPSESAADRDWSALVAAAKQEGKVVIIGPAGADVEEALTQPFERHYPEISVEYTGPPPPQIPPRLLTERAADQYTTDLIIVGTTTIVGTLMPANALDPIRPFLVGPDDRNESVWRGGQFDFADEGGQYNLVVAGRVQIPFIYNPTLVSPSEFSSYQDLLDPKWKGKIAMLDPRVPGAGLDMMTFFYTTPSLGKPFIEQLFAQEPNVARDDRQILDWVAKGQYPLAIGPSGVLAYELKGRGLPLELFPGEQIKEGSFVSGSNATIAVANRAPHPNAIKVYLNFILSPEGQLEWSKASGLASRRSDVPTDFLPESVVPKPGVAYQENYKERYISMKDEVTDLLAGLIKS